MIFFFIPHIIYFKPCAYITHNAAQPLRDITEGHFIRSHAASSWATKDFTLLFLKKNSHIHQNSLKPVNTLPCGKLVELSFKCRLTCSVFIINSSCWTLRYVWSLNKRLKRVWSSSDGSVRRFKWFFQIKKEQKRGFVLQSGRVHTAGGEDGGTCSDSDGGLGCEGCELSCWPLATALITGPRRQCTIPRQIAMLPSINLDFPPSRTRRFICSEMRRRGTTPCGSFLLRGFTRCGNN